VHCDAGEDLAPRIGADQIALAFEPSATFSAAFLEQMSARLTGL
jgi:hypothetical protein